MHSPVYETTVVDGGPIREMVVGKERARIEQFENPTLRCMGDLYRTCALFVPPSQDLVGDEDVGGTNQLQYC